MKNQKCSLCGCKLRPAPAKFDGEPTYVGYFPCPCNETYMTDYGLIRPGDPEHNAMLKRYYESYGLIPVK